MIGAGVILALAEAAARAVEASKSEKQKILPKRQARHSFPGMESFVLHKDNQTYLLHYRNGTFALCGPIKRVPEPLKFEESFIETVYEGDAHNAKEAHEKSSKFLADLDA